MRRAKAAVSLTGGGHNDNGAGSEEKDQRIGVHSGRILFPLIAILENNFRLCTSVIPANAGIQGELGPGVRRDDGNVPFGRNFGEML